MQARVEALTLLRPWPWTFTHLGEISKRLENRSWTPPPWVLGKWIAMHAGAGWDAEREPLIVNITRGFQLVPPEDQHPVGIVAMMRVDGVLHAAPAEDDPRRRWWLGPLAWEVGEVFPLPRRVGCRGMQKLWTVPSCSACGGAKDAPACDGRCTQAQVLQQLPQAIFHQLAQRPRWAGTAQQSLL